MKVIYRHIETGFEKVASAATIVLGNSITFIIAVCMVLFFLISKEFYMQDMHKMIGDMIMSMTFLALFIIQKSFNKYSALIHLKVNELISSNETANNSVLNTNKKTEKEITDLAKEYFEKEESAETLNEKLIHKIEEANTDNQI